MIENSRAGSPVGLRQPATDALVARTSARLMEMGGRQMAGWLRVAPEDLRTEGELARWVERGTTYARSLPAKR